MAMALLELVASPSLTGAKVRTACLQLPVAIIKAGADRRAESVRRGESLGARVRRRAPYHKKTTRRGITVLAPEVAEQTVQPETPRATQRLSKHSGLSSCEHDMSE